jgi:hypothetical protein
LFQKNAVVPPVKLYSSRTLAFDMISKLPDCQNDAASACAPVQTSSAAVRKSWR